jgi:hypothetical protein
MIVFWDIAQCSLVEIDWRFRGAYSLYHQGAMIKEAVRTSETLVSWYQTTLYNTPEDSHLHAWNISHMSQLNYSI